MKGTKIIGVFAVLPLSLALLFQGAACRRNALRSAPTGTPIGREIMAQPPRGNATQLPTGMWGGQHIGMDVTGNGATIEYDCAHGSINRRIELDGDGRFDVQGTFVLESGGPVTPETTSDARPARYAGRVDGRTMTLTLTFTETGQVADTFSLVYGEPPQLTKCY